MDKTLSSSPASATAMAAARMAILVLGPVAISKGWVGADDLDGAVTGAVTVGTAAWGLFKTFKRQHKVKKGEAKLGSLK